MPKTFRDHFLDTICPWDWAFGLLFALNVILFVLLVFSFLIGSPSAETEVISVITAVFMFGTLVMTGGVVRVCGKRDR